MGEGQKRTRTEEVPCAGTSAAAAGAERRGDEWSLSSAMMGTAYPDGPFSPWLCDVVAVTVIPVRPFSHRDGRLSAHVTTTAPTRPDRPTPRPPFGGSSMSPTRPSSSRPDRHRGSALRLPLVAGLSLALAVPALAACQDETGPFLPPRQGPAPPAVPHHPAARPARARSRRTSPPTPVGTATSTGLLHGSSPSPSPDGR